MLVCVGSFYVFFFSSRRRHTRLVSDWSSDVCSSDLCDACTSASASATLSARRRLELDLSVGALDLDDARSEERRVGKECRSRGSRCHGKKKKRDPRWRTYAVPTHTIERSRISDA